MQKRQHAPFFSLSSKRRAKTKLPSLSTINRQNLQIFGHTYSLLCFRSHQFYVKLLSIRAQTLRDNRADHCILLTHKITETYIALYFCINSLTIKKIPHSVLRFYFCNLYRSHEKRRLVCYTAVPYWLL
jgi:hypothetical protein